MCNGLRAAYKVQCVIIFTQWYVHPKCIGPWFIFVDMRFSCQVIFEELFSKTSKAPFLKKWVSNGNPKFVDCVFWKVMSIYVCIYIFMKNSSSTESSFCLTTPLEHTDFHISSYGTSRPQKTISELAIDISIPLFF